ncbi:hypothetical protein N183_38420 [Sinorhizobium sp. Sb3]|nr:hypothetical protein N183_38420 [Sinorhizobium sp. Sb3]
MRVSIIPLKPPACCHLAVEQSGSRVKQIAWAMILTSHSQDLVAVQVNGSLYFCEVTAFVNAYVGYLIVSVR